MGIKLKPANHITIASLKSHYWLKAELIKFCKANGLATVGSKQEIVQRIEAFIVTGCKIQPKISKSGVRDSHQQIEVVTLVKNYNNDAATKRFFVDQIGKHFHFNSYLRQFTNKDNIAPGLTYGDLVAGWLAEESKKKNTQYKTNIGKQFEYNRFVRDFYASEKGKSHAEMVKAWKAVKMLLGDKTYAHYQSILKDKKYET